MITPFHSVEPARPRSSILLILNTPFLVHLFSQKIMNFSPICLIYINDVVADVLYDLLTEIINNMHHGKT